MNMALSEHVDAAFRERFASLTRRCRHARAHTQLEAGMWLVGCPSTVCWPHHKRSRRVVTAPDGWGEGFLTPSMTGGLTDHIWSMPELVTFHLPPPAWLIPT
jgi:hypothetical protein